MSEGRVLSVNVGVPRSNPARKRAMTGIDKRPVDRAVAVHAPGPKGNSGLAGDPIGDARHHGGDDQAVYVYAREDLDWWEKELGRQLSGGAFGENLTTENIDVNATLIGEIWRVGEVLELQATFGRIPCSTFQARMGEPQWVKRFAQENRTGVYLRVLAPGEVRAGDAIEIVRRPERSVTIAEAFRIFMFDHDATARLLEAEGLPTDLRKEAEQRLARR
jgi:MOSC domain-containing protein YiiM